MPATLEMVEAQALELGAADRARLLDRLIHTLDEDQAIETAWMVEAERRNVEINAGEVALVPLDEALGKIRAGFI